MMTQAACENAITYAAVKQLQRGLMPWGWDVEDLAQLTVEDPLKAGAAYDLLPDRMKWTRTIHKATTIPYLGGGIVFPNFERGMAFNAVNLATGIAFCKGVPIAEGAPKYDSATAREWNKAFVCWPKLYPTALKLFAQGLGTYSRP